MENGPTKPGSILTQLDSLDSLALETSLKGKMKS